MDGTMLDTPLLVSRILDHAGSRHAGAEVIGYDATLQPLPTPFSVIAGRAAATAHALSELGVDKGDVVGILTGNRPEAVEVLFAIPSMGAVALPLNFLQPQSHLTTALQTHAVSVLVVDPALATLAASLVDEVNCLTHLVVIDSVIPEELDGFALSVNPLETLLDGHSTSYSWPVLDEKSAALISYTSGTTGSARAVAYTHRSVWLHSMQMCAAENAGLSSADTVLSTIPLYHVISWGLPFAALMAGTTIILARPSMTESIPNGPSFARLLRAHRPTKLMTTPAALHLLLRRLETHPQPLGHLKEVLVGGSTMSPALFDAFVDRHGVTVMQAYGLTESSPLATVARADRHSSATRRRAQMLSQGRFPAAVEARIVDGDHVLPEDGWSVGELEIRGPWVTARYLGDPDDQAERFHDGWLRTGDMATLSPKGFLDVIDRVDDIILSGGEWISSVELGNAVLVDDRVIDAAVVGVPDERWGQRPLVLVRLKSDVQASARSLWEALADRLELWKRPDHWAFVDSIPKTSVGKYDKRLIRARHAAGDYHVTTIAPSR